LTPIAQTQRNLTSC